jgi:uncharacterized protein YqeY
MSLKERITDDMKKYMREKNQLALDTVRMLRSDIKNAEINDRAAGELTDEGVLKVIASSVKKRKDAAEQYRAANRPELAEKEEAEIKFLEVYMPQQLSAEEIQNIVNSLIGEVDVTDKKNFGILMRKVMDKTKNQADGKLVNEIVKAAFDGNN